MASASGRSSSATPRRSGWSRSTAIVPAAPSSSPSPRLARPLRHSSRPQVAGARRAARGACRPRGGRASRARASPRTGRCGPASRCRARAARPRRGRPAPGGCPSPRLPSVVGHETTIVPLSGQQRRCPPASTWMPWTTLVRGPRKPGAVQQLDGRDAVLGAALVQLARLLVGVDVADEAVRVGVGGDRLEPAGRHGADAVRGDADARRRRGRPPRRAGRRRARGRSPTSGSQKRRWPASGGRSRRPSPRGGRRRAAARRRSPAARAASATAMAIAFGSSYGVPSGWWWT